MTAPTAIPAMAPPLRVWWEVELCCVFSGSGVLLAGIGVLERVGVAVTGYNEVLGPIVGGGDVVLDVETLEEVDMLSLFLL